MNAKQELMEAMIEALAGRLNKSQIGLVESAVRAHGDALQKLGDSDDIYLSGLLFRLMRQEHVCSVEPRPGSRAAQIVDQQFGPTRPCSARHRLLEQGDDVPRGVHGELPND